jgi:hypothetical protein
MKKSELRGLIKEEIKKIKINSDYVKLISPLDKNLFESYWLLGELLNPDNSYEYTEEKTYFWVFTDNQGYDFFVRMVYQPVSTGEYWEVKMGWLDLEGKEKYLQQKARGIDEQRSNTIAKIFRDEIIPIFINQEHINTLVIKPLDIKRYQFSLRMVNKFIPKELKIEENKPYEILIKI